MARASPRPASPARTIDLAPTLAYILGIPEPQQSQGRVLTEILKGGNSIKPISIVGLTDFHGQLEQSTLNTFDNAINVPVGGAAALATMFDEEFATLPGPGLLVASGDNVGASPANSGLLQDKPAIDVENAWGLDATSLGNHEFDYGVDGSRTTSRARTSRSSRRTSSRRRRATSPTTSSRPRSSRSTASRSASSAPS